MKRIVFTILLLLIYQISLSQGGNCSSAVSLTVNSTCTNTSFAINTNGSGSAGASCVTAGTAYTDGWYKFVATSSTTVIEISNANRNIGVSVLTTTCSGAEIACQYSNTGVATLNVSTTNGSTYYVRIQRRSGGSNGNLSGSICIHQPIAAPSNDNCTSPVSLTPAPSGSNTCTTTSGTTYGATASAQATCTGIADDDVWYTFVANNATHQVTVDGIAGFNAVVQVLSGTCAGTLTSVQCTNTTGSDGIETANLFGLTPGTTYYIRVYDNASGCGVSSSNTYTICVTSGAAVCNLGTGNLTAASLPYSSGAQTTCGAGDDVTSTNATVCGSSYYYGGEDKVIQFTPTSSGNISINLTSSGSWVGITLYQGCPTTGGTCVAYSQSSAGNQSIGCATVTSGQTYYLVVDSWPTPTCNAFSVTISAPTGGVPAGTTCSNAVPMTLPYTATGQSTLCFGNDYSNASTGSCGTLYESGEDKVYSFTTTGADCFNLTLSNASTTYIGYQVYSGCPGVAGTTCISNGGGATSGVLNGSFSVGAAGTYYLVIDTWASPSYVNYDLELVSLGGAPSNDLPCNAQTLTLGSTASGDNSCSSGTGEPAVPGTWTSGNVNSVWYKLTLTSGSAIVKTITGSLTNTQIAAYTGTCGAGLTFVSANTDIGSCGGSTNYASQLTLTGSAGTVFYIRVDGENNLAGSFSIIAIDGASSFPGVQGQDCSQPNPVCQSVMSVSNPGYSGNGNICDINTGYCLASGERNVVWYRVPISGSGTLNFNIVPNDFQYSTESETDYDFAVWQTAMSGGTLGTDYYNCSQIALGTAPTISCNFSFLGVTGVGTTGNAPTSLSTNVCPTCPGSYNPTTTYSAAYETTIDAIAGDEYLIAISNYSNSTSGFRIEFSGTALINFSAATATAEVYWTGGDAVGPTVWTDADNWGGCTVPSCTRDAFVSFLSNEPVLLSGQTYNTRDLTIQPGATLTLQANSTLEICGNFYNYGTLNADPTSTIIFNGLGNNQTISGSLTGVNRFGNLTINKSSATYSVTLNNDIDIAGTFTTANATSVFNSNGKYLTVSGNFSNASGNTTFAGIGSTGTIEFNGSGSQSYNQGSSQLDLNAVIINNSASAGNGVNLATNMFIKASSGSLTLTLGTITTGALRVEVDNSSASSVTSGNTTSFIDGNLRRYLSATGAFNWPLGNTTVGYQRALTTFSSSSIGYIDGRFDSWPATAGYPPVQNGTECGVTYNMAAMNNGYWTLTANSGTATYDISLYPRNASNVGVNWTVMKRSTLATTGWNLDGSCVSSSSSQVNRNGLSGFSVFGVAQSSTPLPTELILFAGEKVGEDNLLSWKTASEHNTSHFELQRSENGFDFEILATINAAGNSTELLNYEQFDVDPYRNVTYYRLKMIDNDGSSYYSTVISLSRDLGNVFISEVFPNPTSSDISFELINPEHETVINLGLYDQSGRLLDTQQTDCSKGTSVIQFNLSSFSRGIYTLVISSDILENSEVRRIIKN